MSEVENPTPEETQSPTTTTAPAKKGTGKGKGSKGVVKKTKAGKRDRRTLKSMSAIKAKSASRGSSKPEAADAKPRANASTRNRSVTAGKANKANEVISVKAPRWQVNLFKALPKDISADTQISFYVSSGVNAAYKTASTRTAVSQAELHRRALTFYAKAGFPALEE